METQQDEELILVTSPRSLVRDEKTENMEQTVFLVKANKTAFCFKCYTGSGYEI